MAELINVQIGEASAVRKGAIRRGFALRKSEEGVMPEMTLAQRIGVTIMKMMGGEAYQPADNPTAIVEGAGQQDSVDAPQADTTPTDAPTAEEIAKAGKKISAARLAKLKTAQEELAAIIADVEADDGEGDKEPVKKDAALTADFEAQIAWLQAQAAEYAASIASMQDEQAELLNKIAALEAAVAASNSQVEKAAQAEEALRAELEMVRKAAGQSRAGEPGASINVKKENVFASLDGWLRGGK